MKVRKDRMLTAAQDGFMNATDLADYLVERGVPFRDAHAISGRIVRHCVAKGCRIGELSLKDLKGFSKKSRKTSITFCLRSRSSTVVALSEAQLGPMSCGG